MKEGRFCVKKNVLKNSLKLILFALHSFNNIYKIKKILTKRNIKDKSLQNHNTNNIIQLSIFFSLTI